jgi:integrase
MEHAERTSEAGNAGNVSQVLSPAKKPGARITFLAAHKHLHLGIRTQPSGAQRFVVVRRPSGSTKLVVVTLCDVARGDKHAIKLATAVNADMDRGVSPNEQKAAKRDAERAEQAKAKHSFLSVAEAYIARLKIKRKSLRTIGGYERTLRSADLAGLLARPISSITAADIEAIVRKARDRKAPGRKVHKGTMGNAVYKFVCNVVSYALTKPGILAANPLKHFDRDELAQEQSRDRTLIEPYTGDLTELHAIYRGVDVIEPPHHPARTVIKMLALTGLRIGTLARTHADEPALLWSMVKDLDRPEFARLELPWQVRKGRKEGDRVQYVPLAPAAVAILAAIPRTGENTPVFTVDGSSPVWANDRLRRHWRDLADRAAGAPLPHWTPHDIRRSVATGLSTLGCPPAIIDVVLDHSSGEQTKGIRAVYDHAKHGPLVREWLQRWADRLTG